MKRKQACYWLTVVLPAIGGRSERATDVVKRSYRTYALLIERAYYWLRVWLTNAFGCLASGMLDHLICDKLMEQHSSGTLCSITWNVLNHTPTLIFTVKF